MPRALPLVVASALLFASCRTAGKVVKATVTTGAKVTYGTAKFAAKTAYGTAKLAGTIVKDFGYYAARAAFYRKNHDAGALHSAPVSRLVGKRYPKLPAY